MSNNLRVTVVQLNNNSERQIDDLSALVEHLGVEESQFLLLPEMPFFNWLAADPEPDTKKWQSAVDAHNIQIQQLARLGVETILSTRPTITATGSRRNQAYIWTHKSGASGFHDKRYLPDEEGYWEASWYDMGDSEFPLVRSGNTRIGTTICTEMWFYEHARQYGKLNADILCCPRATPHGSTDKWLAGGQAAAVVSGAWHLSSNLYAEPDSFANLGGLSWIISPEGDVMGCTDPDNPFLTIEIDLDFSRAAKLSYPRYVKE